MIDRVDCFDFEVAISYYQLYLADHGCSNMEILFKFMYELLLTSLDVIISSIYLLCS